MSEKILLVDDDKKIIELLEKYFIAAGYQVITAHDGEQALELHAAHQPDLVVLDYLLPKQNGREVCKRLRETSNTPILMLSARDDETDRLIGLELGADDYVGKPFSPREVIARTKAILRRGIVRNSGSGRIIVAGSLRINPVAHEVSFASQPLELTPTEFKILALLAAAPGRVFSRLQIADQFQDFAYEGYERTIDAHIKNLRKKITDGQKRIATVFGVGYKWVSDE
ncbi:MAG: response regulator transcription factor [Negativicutes bacterium]|jgi:DNA-binding response OmpR family regulator